MKHCHLCCCFDIQRDPAQPAADATNIHIHRKLSHAQGQQHDTRHAFTSQTCGRTHLTSMVVATCDADSDRGTRVTGVIDVSRHWQACCCSQFTHTIDIYDKEHLLPCSAGNNACVTLVGEKSWEDVLRSSWVTVSILSSSALL